MCWGVGEMWKEVWEQGVWGKIEVWENVLGCGGGEGRYGKVWVEVKEGVGSEEESVGGGLGKCVGVWGGEGRKWKMWGKSGEVCWGMGQVWEVCRGVGGGL